MKAIVTGGAGFIGSHIAEKLLRANHEVLIIDDLSAGKEENVPDGAWLVRADISSNLGEVAGYKYIGDTLNIMSLNLATLFKGVDVIFHNAASKKNICLKDPARDMEVNGIGTLKLLQLAKQYGIKKFIHASTGSVYGNVDKITEQTPRNPVSYYGISKTAGESYVNYYSKYIDTTILRYFHVWGERQESDPELGGVVSIFMDRVKNDKPITIHGDGGQKRLFTHVSDIVGANMRALTYPTGTVFNCCASETVTIKQLARMIMDKTGNEVEIKYTDPLEGDIYDFNVSSAMDYKFRNFSEAWKDV